MTTAKSPVTPARRPAPSARPSSHPPNGPAGKAGTSRTIAGIIPLKRIFNAESSNYFLLLGTTLFLVVFGLVMVLSASFVEARAAGEDVFGVFIRQGLFAVIGVPLMLLVSRLPITFWKRWAWPALVLGIGLQVLVFVPGVGYSYGHNTNWISIGGVNAQPSEFVKLALALWIAWVITAKHELLHQWRHIAVPILPVTAIAVGFVLLGNDLGTASIMLIMVLGALFFAGVKLRFLVIGSTLTAALGVMFALGSESRTARLQVWLNGCAEVDYSNFCWQIQHGTWALAAGGWFGVGLGDSTATWGWLPEADNDFIFAVIGEELGLVGAVVVLLLFVVLAIAFVRVIRSSREVFAKVATGGIMFWVVGQAFVNIAVVLEILPVLGVPLPLISAGGSALISTLLALGVVLSFARQRPKSKTEGPPSPAQRSRMAASQRARK